MPMGRGQFRRMKWHQWVNPNFVNAIDVSPREEAHSHCTEDCGLYRTLVLGLCRWSTCVRGLLIRLLGKAGAKVGQFVWPVMLLM